MRALTVYGLLLGGAVGGFFLIQSFGAGLEAPAGGGSFGAASAKAAHNDRLLHLLVALLAVIVTGYVLGRVLARFGQPPVIGEVLGGILLGPSFLGRVAPDVAAYVLPQSVAPLLEIVAQLGVILYMFVVGLELDMRALGERGRAAVAISHASIVAPFLLGAALALGIYPILATRDVPFGAFALFLGVSLSVTAFPVLARILTDRKLHTTSLGVVALACAAVDDVTAWCLLAVVVGVAQSEIGSALSVVALTFGYIGCMYFLVRPILARIVPRWENRGLTKGALAAAFAGLLLSSFITERIGIHAIFGAFLLGAAIPHDSRLARELSEKLEALVTVLLLPAFFAYTGMRTEIGLLSGLQNWLICGLIILVATLGKFGGTLAAARITGFSWRDSASLGILMNTRGLMELIVLNIGLDLGVISPTLFAMMVVMAIVTTLATSPILQLLQPRATKDSVRKLAQPQKAASAS